MYILFSSGFSAISPNATQHQISNILQKMYLRSYITNCVIAGADPGGLWAVKTPPEIYQRSQKNDVHIGIKTSDISVLYEIKQPISSKGLHPPHPLLHIWFKTSLCLLKYVLNLALGMIFVLGGAAPPDPLLQRWPLYSNSLLENPGSAPVIVIIN